MRHKQLGFTLVELLVSVAVIAGSAALAAPAISSAMAEQRVSKAQLDLIRIGRYARSEALALGRAHLLRFTKTSSPGNYGRARMYRGTDSGCNTTDWATVTGLSGNGCVAPECIDQANLGDSRYARGTFHNVFMRGEPDQDTIDICYSPSGVMWHRDDTGEPFSDLNNTNGVNGGYLFWTQGHNGSAYVGVRRWTVFPLGGSPRMRR